MSVRSKGGCLSCKKLRIKCDESKPYCEYCRHTNRECCYPEPRQRSTRRRRVVKKVTQSPQTSPSVWDSLFVEDDGKMIARISSPEFELMFWAEQGRAYDQFVYNQTLFAPNIQLSMSKFEFRLLDFFHHYCISRLSLDASDEVGDIWRNRVPALFLRSPLVRCSVFSFAALNILPKCNLNQLSSDSDGSDASDSVAIYSNESTVFDPNLSSSQNLQLLHSKTIEYFLEATRLTREMIGDNALIDTPGLSEHACELTVSSMLIFSFMVLQPSFVIPVVSWDRSQADFLSMGKGIMNTLRQCVPIIMKSEFSGLFAHSKIVETLPSRKTFPLVRKLDEIFAIEYPVVHEFTAQSLIDRETLSKSINQLHMLVHRLVGLGGPSSGSRWVVNMSDRFSELVYEKDFFSLHALFAYAAFSLLRRTHSIGFDNMWLSYMRWYKQHNWDLFDGWKYSYDERLYELTHDKMMCLKSPKMIATFDAEDPQCEEMLMQLL